MTNPSVRRIAPPLRIRHRVPLLAPLLCVATLAACTHEPPDAVGPATTRSRPVTTVTLRQTSPALGRRVMGLVAPFREEEIGFPVGGRVEFAARRGMELAGPTLDASGKVMDGADGDVIAILDPSRYQQALDAAELRHQSGLRKLDAQILQVEQMLPAEVAQAEAQRLAAEQEVSAARSAHGLAKAEFDRKQNLLASSTISEQEFDQAKAGLDERTASLEAARQTLEAATAGVTAATARLRLGEATVEQYRAEINELSQAVTRARQDLVDCTLHAPYSGRITAEHIGRGGYVAPGQPVHTLTMMDPIKVSITVSAENSRRIQPGAQARLYPADLAADTGRDCLYGVVDQQVEVADPTTRTFRVDFLVRNVRQHPADGAPGTALPFDAMKPVLRRGFADGGPLYVASCCLAHDGDQAWVLLIPGLRLGPDRPLDFQRTITPRRVDVTPTDAFFGLLSFSFVAIADSADLHEFDMLVVDPRPEHLAGVRLSQDGWVLRPGDLVPVEVDAGEAPAGLYAPVEAVRTLNGSPSVFVVDGERVRRVPVTVHESRGAQRRIEGEGLADGTVIVLDGVHYLADGDRVRVVPRPPWEAAAAAAGEGAP